MSKEMANKYIKDASTHISTINYALKSIKSNIIANFISTDIKDIAIFTNNVASPSNLQKIEKCIKSFFYNNKNQISTP